MARLSTVLHIREGCTPEIVHGQDSICNEMKKGDLEPDERRSLCEEDIQHGETEFAIYRTLAPLQNTPRFGEYISKTSIYKQTLAHFAVHFGYTTLLKWLVRWNIDLTIADVNGFTALHCAYKMGNRVCVDLLLENGASDTVLDVLGRAPSQLMPEGFASLNDHVIVRGVALLSL